jgi:Concanavalin A-like lectin/glucanases superfamily/FecR protein
MNDHGCDVGDFDRLLSSYCDGVISNRDLARLNQLLRSSPALRRHYLHFVGVHANLSYLIAGAPSPQSSTRPYPRESDSRGGVQRCDSCASAPASRCWRIVGVAACAALLLGGLLGSSFRFWRHRLPSADHLISVPVVARVTREAGVRFDKNGHSAETGGALRAGSYRLVEGVVQAVLGGGADVVITAPAEFELQSQSRIVLKRGRLSARVPEPARGFTVETPTATLIDLGTEFAADVDGFGNGEVHVFRGEVIVKPRSLTDARPLRLGEAQASRIDAASATPSGIELDPSRFLRQLEEPVSAYSRLITTLAPEIYLRMEPTIDGKSLIDSGSPGGFGRLELSPSYTTPWLPGLLGSSLQFRGPSFGDYATVPVSPKSNSKTMSVVAWIFAESRPRWATIVKRWGFVGERCYHFGLSSDDGDLEVHIADSNCNEPVAREGRPLATGCWHHVAFVVDETALHLYRNGVEVAKTNHSGLNQSNIAVISLGAKLTGMGDRPDPIEPGYWHGRLDEVSVFARALEPYQIRQLYQAAYRPEAVGKR